MFHISLFSISLICYSCIINCKLRKAFFFYPRRNKYKEINILYYLLFYTFICSLKYNFFLYCIQYLNHIKERLYFIYKYVVRFYSCHSGCRNNLNSILEIFIGKAFPFELVKKSRRFFERRELKRLVIDD